MSTIADYRGRKFDVLVLQGAKAVGDVLLTQQLFNGNSGQICTGTQKLAQRWTMEFGTEAGSMKYRPARGCQFMRDFRRGRLRTEADVQASFDFAELAIFRNLTVEELDDTPAEERLDHATLLQIAILADRLQLKVRIVSRAGTARAIILPLNTLA